MWYEIELVEELVNSLIDAIKIIDEKDRKKITVDVMVNAREDFETINVIEYNDSIGDEHFLDIQSLKARIHIKTRIYKKFNQLERLGVILNLEWINKETDAPYTMVDYRRWLNQEYCNKVDTIIWGETDCLIPKEMFVALDEARDLMLQHGNYRYITTFADRKMWDRSWDVLTHPKFKDTKYYERHDPETYKHQSSIHYTISQEELNQINEEYSHKPGGFEFVFGLLAETPKFDGSLLCISSDLIKAGVNIPHGIFGLSAEDYAFELICRKIMGKDYKQIIIENVLKGHNREHPKKRMYVKDSTQAKKGDWYYKMREMNKENIERLLNPNTRFLTWEDYKNSI